MFGILSRKKKNLTMKLLLKKLLMKKQVFPSR